jgi:hypothetical protein
MILLIIIVLLILLGGGGYFGYSNFGPMGGVSIFTLVLIIFLFYIVFGNRRS